MKAKTLGDIIRQTQGTSIDDASPSEWSSAANRNYEEQNKEGLDEVQKPAHYNFGKYETIDVILDTLGPYETINYCHGNVLKYVIRMWHKGKPIQDACKAKWYLEKMTELLEKTEGTNW